MPTALPIIETFPVKIPADFVPSDYDQDGTDLGPTSKPCPGYVAPYKPTQGGGFRAPRGVDKKNHRALDIMAAEGAYIVSPAPMTIIDAGLSEKGGWHIYMQDANGWTWYFAHMRDAPLVHKGDIVFGNHLLGYVGRSGNAVRTTAAGFRGCPHLHCSLTVPKTTPLNEQFVYRGKRVDRIKEKVDVLPFLLPVFHEWRFEP